MKENYPHLKCRVKTVSFEDLARDSAKFLYIEGPNRNELIPENWTEICAHAKAAGLILM